ncbi:MAG: (S)-benzoin forming benzil reductase [Clostridia bacterium]|nr:(S)-benzoin forming benzil reductase [Clostridia bacterium]
MNYIIITGTSRGLGESLAEKLLRDNNHIFCISRKKNEKLLSKAKACLVPLDYFEYDLKNVGELDWLSNAIFEKIDKSAAESLCLINNAGTVTPIKPVGTISSGEIANNLSVNLLSPMILTSLFIDFSRNMNIDKRVINISSGAGKKPFFGWGCYCSAKAGLDLFTQCVGLEQQDKEYPVRIISFSPGIIDTEMQKEIRSTKEEDFIQLERFINFKKEGKLLSPDYVADKVIRLVSGKDFKQGGVADITEF